MDVSVDQLLAKVGQLTILLDGANAHIAQLDAENAALKAAAADQGREGQAPDAVG